jgi:hypothetical protein
MQKRKSELRTNPLPLTVAKLPLRKDFLGVSKLQPFFPPLECLFKTGSLENVREYGIKLNESIVSINEEAVLSSGRTVPFHAKITMLLSPYKWMKGEFGTLGLPMLSESANQTHLKLQSHNTAGYVGSILSVALSQSGCQHFPNVFGVFTGTSAEHTIDISDDYEDLSERPWFSSNLGKTFDLKLDEHVGNAIAYSRSARIPLELGEETVLDGVEVLAPGSGDGAELPKLTPIFKEDEEEDSETSSEVSTSYIFQIDSMPSSYAESDCSEDEDDEPFAWATFKQVPVQMTVMEKLDGTFYDLLKLHTEPEKHFAWLAQIVFALAYAQRNFAFTHNDLHGNNIMYIPTTRKFFYYFHAGQSYAVPTYGYLLKIIDFDRGIGSIKLPGMKEARTFMSDQFAAEEEAGGQYNCEPFFTKSHSQIKPNPSFDLVRLATSLFWDLFPEGPKFDGYSEQPLFKLFVRWMTLEDGTSVLFFKNNPKVDRYIGFSLYKAIARYCKDAIPRKEITEFSCFLGDVPAGQTSLVIEV